MGRDGTPPARSLELKAGQQPTTRRGSSNIFLFHGNRELEALVPKLLLKALDQFVLTQRYVRETQPLRFPRWIFEVCSQDFLHGVGEGHPSPRPLCVIVHEDVVTFL